MFEKIVVGSCNSPVRNAGAPIFIFPTFVRQIEVSYYLIGVLRNQLDRFRQAFYLEGFFILVVQRLFVPLFTVGVGKMNETGIETLAMIVSVVVIAGSIAGSYVLLSGDDGGINIDNEIGDGEKVSDNHNTGGENEEPMKYETYSNENFAFSFEYPASWVLKEDEIEENTSEGTQVVGAQAIVSPVALPENKSGKFPEVLVVVNGGDLGIDIENMRKQLLDLKRMVENKFEGSDNLQFEIPKLEGPENIERNGIPGISFVSLDSQGFLRQLGIPRGHSRMEIFEGENFGYYFQFQSRINAYENHKSVLNHITESFSPESSG